MNGVIDLDSGNYSEFVEVDPTGRYGRYNEILGKGSSKTVYKAFDEYEGIEVAWNQVKLYDFLQSPEDLERLYCEIHLLKTLKHSNIMKFYTSWVDTANRNINFVTEMFTSGTLRQYRLRHRKTNIRAIKIWCNQILQGLLYLHSHDPPVIHRDLKCDNIFINGNQGEVKIGDLGLAAILRKSHAARCVGTPEFMAPEVYEEEYNELVDIYSFGMCILEMVTFDYPYSECTHPAQIYKKVVSGKKPDALYKVKDPEVRRFVEKCLATVSDRLSAWELLNDPFLQTDDYGNDLRPVNYQRDYDEVGPYLRQPLLSAHHSSHSSLVNDYSNYTCYDQEPQLDEYEATNIDLFKNQEDDHLDNMDITIKGKRKEDGNIFLKLRIGDKEGRVRNIYFPFDIESDTALCVATEMVAELDITDQCVTKIARMIDDEIASLFPEWKRGFVLEESPSIKIRGFCQKCTPDGSLSGYPSSHRLDKSAEAVHCSKHGSGSGSGSGSVHGRFEEFMYLFDRSDPERSSQSDDGPSSDDPEHSDSPKTDKDEVVQRTDDEGSFPFEDTSSVRKKDCQNETTEDVRLLEAKFEVQPCEELNDISSISHTDNQCFKNNDSRSSSSKAEWDNDETRWVSFAPGKHFPTFSSKRNNYESSYNSCSPVHMVTTKSFCSGALLPHSLHRVTPLSVDATDCRTRQCAFVWPYFFNSRK